LLLPLQPMDCDQSGGFGSIEATLPYHLFRLHAQHCFEDLGLRAGDGPIVELRLPRLRVPTVVDIDGLHVVVKGGFDRHNPHHCVIDKVRPGSGVSSNSNIDTDAVQVITLLLVPLLLLVLLMLAVFPDQGSRSRRGHAGLPCHLARLQGEHVGIVVGGGAVDRARSQGFPYLAGQVLGDA